MEEVLSISHRQKSKLQLKGRFRWFYFKFAQKKKDWYNVLDGKTIFLTRKSWNKQKVYLSALIWKLWKGGHGGLEKATSVKYAWLHEGRRTTYRLPGLGMNGKDTAKHITSLSSKFGPRPLREGSALETSTLHREWSFNEGLLAFQNAGCNVEGFILFFPKSLLLIIWCILYCGSWRLIPTSTGPSIMLFCKSRRWKLAACHQCTCTR